MQLWPVVVFINNCRYTPHVWNLLGITVSQYQIRSRLTLRTRDQRSRPGAIPLPRKQNFFAHLPTYFQFSLFSNISAIRQ